MNNTGTATITRSVGVTLPVSDTEKAAAFDVLADALVNRWHDGQWSWWSRTPCGGPTVETREDAVASLLEWAERTAKYNRARREKECGQRSTAQPSSASAHTGALTFTLPSSTSAATS